MRASSLQIWLLPYIRVKLNKFPYWFVGTKMSLEELQIAELIEQVWETQEFYVIQDDSHNSDYQDANAQESTCWGCREGILNQLGHMDQGGCLYEDDVIETMSASGTLDDEEEEDNQQDD